MVELFVLGGLALAGLTFAAVVGVIFFLLFLLKIVLWIVFLPLRILFNLLWLPVGFALGTLGMTLGLVVVPLLLVVVPALLIFALISAIVSALIPITPFVLLGLLIWAMLRKTPTPSIQ